VSHPLLGSVSCAPPFGLGRCRVGCGSRPVSDGRSGFGGFLDRDLLVPWLLSHQWVVCALSVGPRRCRWGWLFPPRSSFFYFASFLARAPSNRSTTHHCPSLWSSSHIHCPSVQRHSQWRITYQLVNSCKRYFEIPQHCAGLSTSL
jgi:hypothetical protein